MMANNVRRVWERRGLPRPARAGGGRTGLWAEHLERT